MFLVCVCTCCGVSMCGSTHIYIYIRHMPLCTIHTHTCTPYPYGNCDYIFLVTIFVQSYSTYICVCIYTRPHISMMGSPRGPFINPM